MFDTERVLYGDWEEAKDVADSVKLVLGDFKGLEDLTLNGKFLDIGCGDGKLLHEIRKLFPGMKYFGIDLLQNNVERARQNNPYADIREGNFVSMPFREEEFDIIFSIKTLDYSGWRQEGPFAQTFKIEDLSKEIYRVLKRGGVYYAFEGMEGFQRQPFKDVGLKPLEENECYALFQK